MHLDRYLIWAVAHDYAIKYLRQAGNTRGCSARGAGGARLNWQMTRLPNRKPGRSITAPAKSNSSDSPPPSYVTIKLSHPGRQCISYYHLSLRLTHRAYGFLLRQAATTLGGKKAQGWRFWFLRLHYEPYILLLSKCHLPKAGRLLIDSSRHSPNLRWRKTL